MLALLPALLLLLAGRVRPASVEAGGGGESVRWIVEPYCANGVRIRVSPLGAVPHGPTTPPTAAGALLPTCADGPLPVPPPAGGMPVTNGNIYASIVGGWLNVRAVDTGVALLSGPLPTFSAAAGSCASGPPPCTPTAPDGAPCTQSGCCKSLHCDPSLEKCSRGPPPPGGPGPAAAPENPPHESAGAGGGGPLPRLSSFNVSFATPSQSRCADQDSSLN